MEKLGYARVSAKDQNELRQLIALREFGIKERNIYIDKQSGKDFNRPNYKRLLKRLRTGDTICILSIDRLGRNYDEIIEQWRVITKEKQADIVVLVFPLLDTRARQNSGDLTGRFVADLVLQILAYAAQREREMIHQRQAEGIAAAKARGVRFGHEKIAMPPEFAALKAMWLRGEITCWAAGERLGISYQTFYRRAKEE